MDLPHIPGGVKRRCAAITNEHCIYAQGGMDIDAARLNETLEAGIQSALWRRAHDEDGHIPPEYKPGAYSRGLEDAYLAIRECVFKTKDYETARMAAGHD